MHIILTEVWFVILLCPLIVFLNKLKINKYITLRSKLHHNSVLGHLSNLLMAMILTFEVHSPNY
jgi:hypothetical protein